LKELVKLVIEGGSQLEFQTMISAYLAEDIIALDLAMIMSGMMADYRSILLDERNKTWVPLLEEAMKTNSIFMAVGAGHLGGDNGVISLLQKACYSVEPIH
jgi:uncharacterized protein